MCYSCTSRCPLFVYAKPAGPPPGDGSLHLPATKPITFCHSCAPLAPNASELQLYPCGVEMAIVVAEAAVRELYTGNIPMFWRPFEEVEPTCLPVTASEADLLLPFSYETILVELGNFDKEDLRGDLPER